MKRRPNSPLFFSNFGKNMTQEEWDDIFKGENNEQGTRQDRDNSIQEDGEG